MVERCVDAHLSPSKPVRYTASTLPNYAHWRTQHARHVFFQARRMNIPVNTSNHQYCSSKRAEEKLKGNGENVRNDDTYTTRHKRCRSPALNEQVSTRNDHNMSHVTPYLSSCVLLFCQPVFSDHYTAHIMYECTPNTVPETTQTWTVIKPRARRKDHNVTLVKRVITLLSIRECTHQSVQRPLKQGHERPSRAKEHSSRDGDEHNMHDENITPLAMCVTARLPLPECAKEHSSRDSDEHNMHDERSHRSRCVLPLDCPYPSVPKNTQAGTVTNTTCKTKRSHRPPCVSTAHCSHRSVPKNTSERTVTNTT
ncbi:hypothetical protein Bbelb_420230 [Branchiostoma belcheri]|nr:hypothetical protein Bbelb_420230 [Branchiostoma belcheri]